LLGEELRTTASRQAINFKYNALLTVAIMSSDEELGTVTSPPGPKKDSLYNGVPTTQDSGILSRLRNIEAQLDAKLGIESEAINRKLPEDKHPVKWHEELSSE
jgi:hypothetical protein